MPRVELQPEDEAAVVAQCLTLIDAGAGTVRALHTGLAGASFPDITLTDVARVVRRRPEFNAQRNGRVART